MRTVVIIGLGQLGRVFAGGLLRSGYGVVPVNRGDAMQQFAMRHPRPDCILLAVAEADLHPVLAALPMPWRDRIALIQNELLPRDWTTHRLANPTVASVWFEKKPGSDAKPLLATPVYGPQAGLLVQALQSIDLPARVLDAEAELLYELVRKNVYILTTNIAGILSGGTVGELWAEHRPLAIEVAHEVMDIQDWLTGVAHDRERLMAGLLEAIDADPQHGCRGRSAADRLKRNLAFANEAGLAVPKLREIAAEVFA